MQAVPGLIEPTLFGFKTAEIADMYPDAYLVKVLESYFDKYLEITEKDGQFLLLNYNEGPMPMV